MWKARCKCIFRDGIFYCNIIAKQIIAHIREYSCSINSSIGKTLFLSNFTEYDGPFLFSSALWNEDLGKSGAGFLISNAKADILAAESTNLHPSSHLDTEIKAMPLPLQSDTSLKTRLMLNTFSSPILRSLRLSIRTGHML